MLSDQRSIPLHMQQLSLKSKIMQQVLLKSFQTSILRAFAQGKLKMDEMMKFVPNRIEKNCGKGVKSSFSFSNKVFKVPIALN